MLAKIIGIIWIILGMLWLIKPQTLRDRLKRKMTRKIKWIVFLFILFFALSLLGSIIRAEGASLKIVGLLGLFIVIKSLYLVTAKTADKISTWWQGRSLLFFRLWGLFILATGVMLIFT